MYNLNWNLKNENICAMFDILASLVFLKDLEDIKLKEEII